MRPLALASVERSPGLKAGMWALIEDVVEGNHVRCSELRADGTPADRPVRAQVQPTPLPPGTAAWLCASGGATRVPCVIRADNPGGGLSAETPFGVVESSAVEAWPIQRLGACPGATGPALVAARTPIARASIDPRRFALRWATNRLRGVLERDGVGGATWIDVALIPHQIAVVREVLGAPAVRHVLADEVGLGKTIEALMIWSALSAHDPTLKCVVATPRSLVLQWCLEVRRRTERRLLAGRSQDLPPVFVTGAPEESLNAPNERGLAVAEHAALPDLYRRVPKIDMLIVDEAHTLTREQQDAVQSIAKGAKHLLLLTATPREGRAPRGAARARRKGLAWAMSLVDPKWPPPDREAATLERECQRIVDAGMEFAAQCDGEIARGITEPSDQIAEEGSRLADALSTVLPSAARDDIRALARCSTLLERLVRTRRRSLQPGLIATRELTRVSVEYRVEEVAILEAVNGQEPEDLVSVARQASSSWAALAESKGGRSKDLRERLGVIRDAAATARPDAKLEALVDLCARVWAEDPKARVLIRCEYKPTLELVVDKLKELLLRGGLRRTSDAEIAAWQEAGEDVVGPVAQLDQGQDAMLEALQNPSAAGRSMLGHLWAFESTREGSALALVATDVGSVGLNLQFASALVFYDLPWSPGLVEQWIGRVDRIGQRAGVVRVYAMSHPALPTERLLDVYEAIGLFDKGYRASREVDEEIGRLLQPAASEERTWEEIVEQIKARLEDEDEDPDRGAAFDLSPAAVPDAVEAEEATRAFFEALRSAGLDVDWKRDETNDVRWPDTKVDSLYLRAVAPVLRSRTSFGKGSSPEKLAEMREGGGPTLRLTTRRLGEGRWLRGWTTDFFSPRHPLFAAVEEEMQADPSLALGGFTCESIAGGVAPGLYLLAQTQTFPAAGGEAMAWRCGVEAGILEDEVLAPVWASLVEGLRRAMRVRCAPLVEQRAWRVDRQDEKLRPLPQERVSQLLSALVEAGAKAKPTAADKKLRSVRDVIASLEKPPIDLSREVLTIASSVAEAISRDVLLRVDRLISERRRRLEAVGEGDSWRGLRERGMRDLASAIAFRDRVASLPSLPRIAALEASTPRVVAAAVVEVRA